METLSKGIISNYDKEREGFKGVCIWWSCELKRLEEESDVHCVDLSDEEEMMACSRVSFNLCSTLLPRTANTHFLSRSTVSLGSLLFEGSVDPSTLSLFVASRLVSSH